MANSYVGYDGGIGKSEIDAHPIFACGQALPMSDASADGAMMHCQRTVALDIGDGRAGSCLDVHFGASVIAPDGADAPAERAVTGRQRLRPMGQRQPDRTAMAGRLDHVPIFRAAAGFSKAAARTVLKRACAHCWLPISSRAESISSALVRPLPNKSIIKAARFLRSCSFVM